MRLLGAILAGGRSSRFGSDKALALHEGRPLISHVADALRAQCAEVVVCGRSWDSLPNLPDVPAPGLGPMAGLCAALRHGEANAFAAVLSAPCDVLDLPQNAAQRLAPGPAAADSQWLVGLWPVTLAALLEDRLTAEGAISARRFISLCGAEIRSFPPIRNVNRPADLA